MGGEGIVKEEGGRRSLRKREGGALELGVMGMRLRMGRIWNN